MRFSASLKLNHVFRRLYHTSGFADSCLVLYARRNRTGGNRVGITVSKKLGHAVVRNIVVVARARAVEVPFGKLAASYLSLAAKAGILREEGNPQ